MKTLALFFIFLFFAITANSQNFWQPLNGPYKAVFISQVSLSPNNLIFLSTLGGGIYRSSDNGSSWQEKVNGFANPIYDDGTVVFAFNSSGHIFATSFTNGVWRSINNGDSWTQTGLNNAFIIALGINQAGYVFAAQGGGGGIYRSTNNGDNWTQTNSGLPQPITFRSIICKTGGMIFAGGNNFSGACIFKTTNNGDNWQPTSLTNVTVNSLALNSSGDIFAGSSFNGIYRSSNNGDNWTQINNGLLCLRINQVFCDYQNNLLAASDSGLFRSTDNGNSWLRIGFTNKEVSTSLLLQNGSYFAGVYSEGAYRSINNGINWSEVNNGINSEVIYSIAINQSGHIFAGAQTKKIQKSTDNGNSWLEASNGLHGNPVNVLASAPNNFLFAQTDSGTFRSTDSGNNWIQVFGGIIRFNDFVFKQNGHIYAPSSYPGFGVWLSTNNGLNWNSTNMSFQSSVYCLTINQSGHLFAGTAGGGVYRSTDNGLNWIQSEPYSSVHALSTAPNGYIYAAMQSVSGGNNGVYRSTNSGVSWQYMGLNILYASSIRINSAGHIFVSSIYSGVFRSTNMGSSWEHMTSGMFNNMTWCMAFNPQGYLYAGTWGNSIYRSSAPTIGVEQISAEVPSEYSLSQNYPNPFNPVTNIEFAVPNSSFVKLVIYDITGRVVETLINENLKAGTYKADWDASNFPSGVYFYKIQAEGFTETKKMMLVK